MNSRINENFFSKGLLECVNSVAGLKLANLPGISTSNEQAEIEDNLVSSSSSQTSLIATGFDLVPSKL